MPGSPFSIKIESILGGQAQTTHFARAGEFKASLGIDPSLPMDDSESVYSTIASGLIRPMGVQKISAAIVTSSPLWIVPNPKNALIYVYSSNGSAYTIDSTLATVTALSDAGNLSSSLGNGCEYYDNYMYFFKNTDVARYGPLNGVPVFNPTYWTGTLGKTALSNTTYPTSRKNNLQLPNHVAHRHSDGVLYFADIVGNQGYLHSIDTTKGSVEGDTDNGSTYLKLPFGYGLYPTALESYGSDLAIALYEGSSGGVKQSKAKMAFWDTTSTNFNKITWVEFPDSIITAMKNVNGVLYVVSGNYQSKGFRVTRFLGGYSFEEVFYSETGEPCLPGAIDGILNRVLVGSHTTVPESDGCVFAHGLQKSSLSKGMFNIMRSTGGNSSTSVTALAYVKASNLNFDTPVVGWSQAGEGSSAANYGIDIQGSAYNNAASMIWFPILRIGKPFKITRITIPFVQPIGANMTVIPKIYVDDGDGSFTLQTINNTNYPGKYNIIMRADANNQPITGQHDLWLELRWSGSALATVAFPITIEGEIYDDQ